MLGIDDLEDVANIKVKVSSCPFAENHIDPLFSRDSRNLTFN